MGPGLGMSGTRSCNVVIPVRCPAAISHVVGYISSAQCVISRGERARIGASERVRRGRGDDLGAPLSEATCVSCESGMYYVGSPSYDTRNLRQFSQ